MNEKELSDRLDELLEHLHAGIPIEHILKDYPAQSAELVPLLEAAAEIRQLTANLPDITEAQSRSRAIFLSEAAKVNPTARRKRVRLSLPFRLTGSIVLVMGFLLAITGLASANSLPGEQLYPLKLAIEQAQIGLTADPTARLQLQQTFEQQRSGEVSALIQQGRNQQVTFYGFVAIPKQGPIEVAGLPVTLPPEQAKNIIQLAGSYVAVTGKTGSKGVVAVGKIHIKTVQLDGPIQNMQENHWKVNNLDVILNSNTEIQGKPKNGQHVYINATRLQDGKLMAVAINLDQPDANKEANELLPAPNETPEPHRTERSKSSRPTATATPSPTVTPSPTQTTSASATKRAFPSATPTVQVKSKATHDTSQTPTRTVRPTKTQQATATPTVTVKPIPNKTTPTPTAIRADTLTPSPNVTTTAILRKSQSPQTQNDGLQEEKHEPADPLDNDQLIPLPTPTPAGSNKGRHNNSLVPTPDQNGGPLIQSSDLSDSSQQVIESPSDPIDSCLATSQVTVVPSNPGGLPYTQTTSPDCTPAN